MGQNEFFLGGGGGGGVDGGDTPPSNFVIFKDRDLKLKSIKKVNSDISSLNDFLILMLPNSHKKMGKKYWL